MSFWGIVENVFSVILENGSKRLESDIRSCERMLKTKDLNNNQREALQKGIKERRQVAARANDFVESKKRK